MEDDGRLLVVVFEGSIEPEEERNALVESTQLPGLRKDARVLVDRRRARMAAGPEDVAPQQSLARQVFADTGRPRMAIVVTTDYDFGMARMLELSAGDELPHQLQVFRDMAAACTWLDVDPEILTATAGDAAEGP